MTAALDGVFAPAPATAPDPFQAAVADELFAQRARRAARRLLDAEEQRAKPGPDAGTLAELLARPVEDRWRIHGVLPAGGRGLFVAQRKLGKTTLLGNIARSLLTGEPFLGRFDVEKLDGCVVALNYEVTGAQFARWMDDIGVPPDRMFVINLRGRRNLLADDDGRAELAELIRAQGGEVVIVDPFGRAYTGRSQNDAAEVTPWLVRLDELAESAGVREVLLSAHAGWDQERTRGSTGLEDWPDSVITMTRDQDTGERFIRAEGRDVEVAEDRLHYDPATRRLSLTGAGNRSQVRHADRLEKLAVAVRDVVAETPGLNTTELREALRARDEHLQREDASAAAKLAESRGWVTRVQGARGALLHHPGILTSGVPSSPEASPGQVVSSPDPSYRGGTTQRTTQPPAVPPGTLTEDGPQQCTVCGEPLHPTVAADGFTTCPSCAR